MANPSKSKSLLADSNSKPLLSDQVVNIPSYDITWTSNEPTPGDTATIANGTIPTVAELGQAVADITAKLNLLIAALESHGLTADA